MRRALSNARLALLGLALAAQAHGAGNVLEKTESISGIVGVPIQVRGYEFAIGSAVPHVASLFDNGLLAPFDYLSLAVTRTGGETLGFIEGAGSFTFSPGAVGSYTALVFADPGEFRPGVELSTFGVTVTPVPEAETYLMMLSGLALLGVVAGRRLNRIPR